MKKIPMLLTGTLALLAALTLLLAALHPLPADGGGVTEIRTVTLTADGQTREAELPVTLAHLAPRTPVTVRFSLTRGQGNTLFFGSVYAPLTVRADGQEIYTWGEEGTYPAFFGDPPTQYDSVRVPEGETVQIEMTWLSPARRSSLSLHAPAVGSGRAVLQFLAARHGVSMLAAMFFLTLGLLLVLAAMFFLKMENASRYFLLPGLLCLSAGAWQLGENTLSVYLLHAPSLLYVLAFLGLFLVVIPLYRMALLFLQPRSRRLLKGILYLMELSALSAVLLLLTGLCPFHRSLYYFHVLLPLAIAVLAGCALWDYLHDRSRNAGLFFVLLLILALAALLELINYRTRFLRQYSVIFQAGLFLFVTATAAFSGLSARNLFSLRIKNLTLENEVKLQEQTITAQKNRSEMLLSHYEEIRRQRHDIRHHLRTIDDILGRGDTAGAQAYIRSVAESVPSYSPEKYCGNATVNAAISYYAQQAREAGIRLDIRTQIPADNPNITDANLCVIFGNLLENALEACGRMRGGSRFITLNAQVRGETLFITMDNSYDGSVRSKDSRFYSSKRAGFGTGLRSIESLAAAHQGGAAFRGLENAFRSEVFLRL